MRGQWFIDGSWLPLEEDESDLIEIEHLARFRGQQMRDTYEMDVVTTTVDIKDGKRYKTQRRSQTKKIKVCVERSGVYRVYRGCKCSERDNCVCVCAHMFVLVCARVCVGGGGVNSSIQKRPQNKSGDDILADSSRTSSSRT